MAAKKTTSKATAKAPKKAAAKKTTARKTTAKKLATKTIVKSTPAKKPTRKTPAKAAIKKTTAKKAATQTKQTTKPAPKNAAAFKELETIMKNQPFQFDQLSQDAANQSRESVEAFVKSGTIFAKGFEDIMKIATEMTQNVAEKQAEFTKQLMGSKTLNEFAETQNKIAQNSFNEFMSGATQLSEMSVKVLSEAAEPLNTQMTAAMQKANKQMAA